MLFPSDKAVIDREQRKLQPVGDAEFVENIPEVMLHRLFADGKLFRYLPSRESRHDSSNHFDFTSRQPELLRLGMRWLRRIDLQRLHHIRHIPVTHPKLAVCDSTDAVQ